MRAGYVGRMSAAIVTGVRTLLTYTAWTDESNAAMTDESGVNIDFIS